MDRKVLDEVPIDGRSAENWGDEAICPLRVAVGKLERHHAQRCKGPFLRVTMVGRLGRLGEGTAIHEDLSVLIIGLEENCNDLRSLNNLAGRGNGLCEMFHYRTGLPCLILRTSRFFPEEDDDERARQSFVDANLKVNELLHRRGDIADMASAHLLAVEKAPNIGFGRYIISATTPFTRSDLQELRKNAPAVVKRYVPEFEAEYARRAWKMSQSIDRVYVNELARAQLGWQPRYDFHSAIRSLRALEDFRSPLARAVGSKGYHAVTFSEGPYPTK